MLNFCVIFTTSRISGLSLVFSRGQVRPDLRQGMANVCYYCKLNNMLMCEIM